MFQEQTFDGDGVTLNYATGPANGPALVLLHGVSRRWQDFVPLLPALSLRWQVYALDFRGHGCSDRTPGRYLVADYTRDARSFLGEVVKEPAVVYGHSLGAMVAAGIAAERPEAVRAIVLEDPPFATARAPLTQSPFYGLFAGMHELTTGDDADVDTLTRRMADIRMGPAGHTSGPRLGDLRDATALRFSAQCLTMLDPDVFPPILDGRWLEGFDIDAILPRITCPALLLQADEALGGMLSDRTAERAASLMPRCTRIRMPQVGHLVHWMQTETTLRLVTGFLESL